MFPSPKRTLALEIAGHRELLPNLNAIFEKQKLRKSI